MTNHSDVYICFHKQQAINMCCNNSIQAYTEGSRQRLHPSENLVNIEAVSSCVNSLRSSIAKSCKEEYDTLKSCMTENKESLVKCQGVKKLFDVCVVKNKLGELSH